MDSNLLWVLTIILEKSEGDKSMQDEDDEWRRNNDDDKVFLAVKVFYWVTDIFLNLHMYDWDLYETTTKAFLDWIPYAVISGILIVLMIIFEINRVLRYHFWYNRLYSFFRWKG